VPGRLVVTNTFSFVRLLPRENVRVNHRGLLAA
jgi:hypothetical protein